MSTLISIDTHTHTEHSSSVINISALLMADYYYFTAAATAAAPATANYGTFICVHASYAYDHYRRGKNGI